MNTADTENTPHVSPMPTRHRILVVDDEADTRDSLAEALSCSGYNVATAANGTEALDRIEKDSLIEVVLLDLLMPEMGGLQTLAMIMAHKHHPEVILVTGLLDDEIARHAVKLGAFDFIAKPIDFSRLESLIGVCLSHAEFRHQPFWKRMGHSEEDI